MPAQISIEVANALHWDYSIPRDTITAEVADGWVTLRGTVAEKYQKSSAEADVLRLADVVGVKNEIVVRPLHQIELANLAAPGL